VSKWLTKSWLFRFMYGGKPHWMGLGSAQLDGLASGDVTLKQARDRRDELRQMLISGIDPLHERRKLVEQTREEKLQAELAAKRTVTFAEAVQRYLEESAPAWKPAYRRQNEFILHEYALPKLGKLTCSQIDMLKVKDVLLPLWLDKTTTAQLLRLRIENVLDWARVNGYCEFPNGVNPAKWRGNLQKSGLPKPSDVHTVTPRRSQDYSEMPSFLSELLRYGGTLAKLMTFLLLTGVRIAEAAGATWDEVDFKRRVWTISFRRMKRGESEKDSFRVPLSDAAVALLKSMPRDSDLVFPSPATGNPITRHGLRELLRRMDRLRFMSTHGLRSSFTTWAADNSTLPDADTVADHCLSHEVGSRTYRAYQRGTKFNKRATLLQEWANYLTGKAEAEGGKVVKLPKTA
jgi:integrase